MAYQTINSILKQTDRELSAAEAHGMATGLLCVNEQAMCSYWLTELFQSSYTVENDDKLLLERLFEETRRMLASEEFEFDLFLPEDNCVLSEQLSALKSWCYGFLVGIGSAHLSIDCSQDARDILKDITEFTKLHTEAGGEEDETAFTEVTEYLRTAVLLLRDEFNSNYDRTFH